MIGSEAAAKSYRPQEFSAQKACETIASINYSSGTTGVPKGLFDSIKSFLTPCMAELAIVKKLLFEACLVGCFRVIKTTHCRQSRVITLPSPALR